MKEIIPPVETSLLEKELNADRLIRDTNFGNNQIYIVTYHNAPNVLREIGRLREITFRAAGGGTGKEIDIDDYDIGEDPYEQLIVWDPREKKIIGGYRFVDCSKYCSEKVKDIRLATTKLFKFSNKFKEEYLPYMIELGRSFVVPSYQARQSEGQNSKKGIYTLDNLWDGLGAIISNNTKIKYFFGKVTMYPHYISKARDMILFFLQKHFGDREELLVPLEAISITTDKSELEALFIHDDYLANYKILFHKVRELGENIPPLISAYMNLSPTLKVFGTAINEGFGLVEETAMMVTIGDIYKTKKDRHILLPQK